MMGVLVQSVNILCTILLINAQDIYFDDATEFEQCNATSGVKGECRFPKDCSLLIKGKIAGERAKICGFTSGSSYLVCCPKTAALIINQGVSAPDIEFECGIRGTVTIHSPSSGVLKRERRNLNKPLIVGGRDSTLHSWPWMVLLGKGKVSNGINKPAFFCDGVLINTRFILTAAHCLQDPGSFFVRLGEHNYQINDESASPQDVDMEAIFWHPKHNFDLGYNDLAIVKLAQDINIWNAMRPICLPWNKYSNSELANTEAVVTGWGAGHFGGPRIPTLQEATVKIFNSSKCEKSYSTLDEFKSLFPNGMNTENVICAGDDLGGKDACQGDSGGPLVQKDLDDSNRYVLVAIVSKGQGCGKKDFPGLYAPIRSLETLQWIKNVAFSL